jgi:hypothetical protein
MLFSGKRAKQTTRDAETLLAEIKRIEALAAKVASKLDDPECDLTSVMRLSACQKELQAYRDGIRYALGAAPLESEVK